MLNNCWVISIFLFLISLKTGINVLIGWRIGGTILMGLLTWLVPLFLLIFSAYYFWMGSGFLMFVLNGSYFFGCGGFVLWQVPCPCLGVFGFLWFAWGLTHFSFLFVHAWHWLNTLLGSSVLVFPVMLLSGVVVCVCFLLLCCVGFSLVSPVLCVSWLSFWLVVLLSLVVGTCELLKPNIIIDQPPFKGLVGYLLTIHQTVYLASFVLFFLLQVLFVYFAGSFPVFSVLQFCLSLPELILLIVSSSVGFVQDWSLVAIFWCLANFWVLTPMHRSMFLGLPCMVFSSGPELLGFSFVSFTLVQFYTLASLGPLLSTCNFYFN